MKLDRYDRAIVRALQLDGRITNSQLAETVNLSESASLRRVRALEESGFIEGYTALKDADSDRLTVSANWLLVMRPSSCKARTMARS